MISEENIYEIATLESGDALLAIVFMNGEPLPTVFENEVQASVYIDFVAQTTKPKASRKHLVSVPAKGLPPGYLVFALYEDGEFRGIIVWGPLGILPDVYPDMAEAVAAASRDFEHRRPPAPVNETPSAPIYGG